MAPKIKKAKEPKRPTWSIWKDKTDGKIYADIEHFFHETYDWPTRTYIQPTRKREEFEAMNPLTFRLTAPMQFTNISVRQSSTHFYFKDLSTEQTYIMLPKDMKYLIENSIIQMGAVHGSWGFVKKGSTVAIFLDEEILEEEDSTDNST